MGVCHRAGRCRRTGLSTPARLQEAVAVRAPSRHGAQAQLGLEAMPACHRETEAPSQAVEGGRWHLAFADPWPRTEGQE